MGGRRGDRWRLRPIRFHPEGAACRGEAAPRPYLLVACPHLIDGLGRSPDPFITTRDTGRGARPLRLRPIRFHPDGAACRGEAAPRPYLLVACPHPIDGLGRSPDPFITTRDTGGGARPWRLRPIRFHPEGAACRGEAAPRPYLLVACPHLIDGLGLSRKSPRTRHSRESGNPVVRQTWTPAYAGVTRPLIFIPMGGPQAHGHSEQVALRIPAHLGETPFLGGRAARDARMRAYPGLMTS
jgi:hypothetical protein